MLKMKKLLLVPVFALACVMALMMCACSGSSEGGSGTSKDAGLSIGDTITTDYCEFTIDSVEWLEEISYREEGQYISYTSTPGKAEDGKTHLAITATIKNTGTESYYPHTPMSAKISIGKYNYDAEIDLAQANGISELDPLDTKTYVIHAAIPNELKGNGDSVVVTFGFGKDSSTYSSIDKADKKYTMTLENS